MKSAVYGLVIHGVGEQTAGYSSDAQEWLAAGCSKRGKTLYAREVLWAPLADLRSAKFLKECRKRGSGENPLKKLFAHTFSDALAYRQNSKLQTEIFDVIDQAVLRLRGEPVHIFAHSLGGLVALDYLHSRTNLKVAKLVTFGCNVPLFYLGDPTAFRCPAQLREPGKWVNAFYSKDFLGYPLAGCEGMEHVEDTVLEEAPGLTWSDIVPGLSHVDYFEDKRFWKGTLPGLARL